ASWFGHRAEISRDRQIDILRLPIRERLQTIDPAGMNLLAESFIASHVYDGLVRRSDDGQHILPNLAHAWEVDETRHTWTFHLRKGVVFHDGRELTAADVVYSLDRLRAPGQRSLYAPLFRQIRSVRAWTNAAVIIELASAHELLLPLLCTSRAAIVSSQGESEPVRVGTGPFKPVRLEPHLCVLEAYPHYHLGRAQLDRVE
ncbi:ABC transporter substrate-binding protein, partial [Paenibacillus sp. 598K]|uniref:ABC transporter substrate-binding protein n=1 Tax=Paenibacillus sp. 598K TaxID=1117987 RepID=UPI0021A977C8